MGTGKLQELLEDCPGQGFQCGVGGSPARAQPGSCSSPQQGDVYFVLLMDLYPSSPVLGAVTIRVCGIRALQAPPVPRAMGMCPQAAAGTAPAPCPNLSSCAGVSLGRGWGFGCPLEMMFDLLHSSSLVFLKYFLQCLQNKVQFLYQDTAQRCICAAKPEFHLVLGSRAPALLLSLVDAALSFCWGSLPNSPLPVWLGAVCTAAKAGPLCG